MRALGEKTEMRNLKSHLREMERSLLGRELCRVPVPCEERLMETWILENLSLIVLCITVHLSVTSFLFPNIFLFSFENLDKSDSMNFSVVFYSYVNFIEGLISIEFHKHLSFFQVTHSSFRNYVNVHLSKVGHLKIMTSNFT